MNTLRMHLRLKGDKPDDHMQKGRIYTIQGDYESAIDNLQKAIDGKLVKANYYMGEAYSKQGDGDNASKYYQAYLDSGEADAYDLFNMGQSQMEQGNYATAITYFDAALDLDEVPNKQELMKNEIIAYEYSGDFASAKECMEDYIEEYPDDSDAEREYQFLETR